MLILASNSPRRKEMLSWLGIAFVAKPAHMDETPQPSEAPREYVKRLAHAKAILSFSPGDITLGADTTVADGRSILGKPEGEGDAESMLRRLRGRTHAVHTALSLITTQQELPDACSSEVEMRSYSDAEIEEYIRSGDPLDKAGAYAIQHRGFHPVVNFSGCMANVMGLPLCHLRRSLKKMGVLIDVDVPQACRNHLHYDCVISERIAAGDTIG